MVVLCVAVSSAVLRAVWNVLVDRQDRPTPSPRLPLKDVLLLAADPRSAITWNCPARGLHRRLPRCRLGFPVFGAGVGWLRTRARRPILIISNVHGALVVSLNGMGAIAGATNSATAHLKFGHGPTGNVRYAADVPAAIAGRRRVSTAFWFEAEPSALSRSGAWETEVARSFSRFVKFGAEASPSADAAGRRVLDVAASDGGPSEGLVRQCHILVQALLSGATSSGGSAIYI